MKWKHDVQDMVTLSTEKLKVLQERVLLFEGLSLAQTMHILQKTEKRLLRDGDVITDEHEIADTMFILISGQAVVTRDHSQKKETLAILEPGSTVGEMAIIDRSKRSARVIAKGDTVILELSHEIIDDFPTEILQRLYRNFAVILARRVRSANARMAKIAARPEQLAMTDDTLRQIDISGWDIGGIRAKRAKMIGADFRGVDLRDADLRGADLRGARLDGADLRDTVMSSARLGEEHPSLPDGLEVESEDEQQSWEDLMKSLAKRAKGGGSN
ncbi:MAG: cyclic nucleotide-binding domain-containing protein [Myxococcota bacterium]|nr:cyclic nucleotide-binding domain-containing protein [Myxococcota bacterium]